MLFIVLQQLSLVCLIILGVITLVLLLYYFGLFARFSFRKEKPLHATEDFPPVSIVITARDEAHNLIKSLPSLLTQEYPNYEVVLVNDNSRDETASLLVEYKQRYNHLHPVDLSSSISNMQGKRFPLSIGIQAATHEKVLLTDACCIPSSPYWLQHVAQQFVRNTQIVIGHVTCPKQEGANNRIQRYDALMSSLQAFSYAMANMPVLANGRNLAYTKTIFFQNQKKFVSQFRLPFGDDDIFINEIAKKNIQNVVSHPDATIIQPQDSFFNWLRKKRFQCISRSHYKLKSRFVLRNYNCMSLLFYFAAIVALIVSLGNLACLLTAIGIIVVKIASQYVVQGMAAAKLNEKKLIPLFLWYDIVFAFLNPLINLASNFEKWK